MSNSPNTVNSNQYRFVICELFVFYKLCITLSLKSSCNLCYTLRLFFLGAKNVVPACWLLMLGCRLKQTKLWHSQINSLLIYCGHEHKRIPARSYLHVSISNTEEILYYYNCIKSCWMFIHQLHHLKMSPYLRTTTLYCYETCLLY